MVKKKKQQLVVNVTPKNKKISGSGIGTKRRVSSNVTGTYARIAASDIDTIV